ncbi:hypothetical protein JCM8097_001631 [Rhodosporidiobolus ruineniae]
MARPPQDYPPPQPFLISILPILLSPDVAPLPPLLLSDPARHAIHYLALNPTDDAYWTSGSRDEAVVRKRTELIEAGSIDDIVLGEPHYHHDLEDTQCIIPLSLPDSSSGESLGVVLLWEDALPPMAAAEAAADRAEQKEDEEDDDTRPGWTFLELQALSQPPGEITVPTSNGRRRPSWFPSLSAAVQAASVPLDSPAPLARRDSPPELLEFSRNSPALGRRSPPPPQRDSPLAQAQARYSPEAPQDGDEADGKKRKKAPGEMEDGNGAATPGAYGTAEDFWDGWSEDEEDGAVGGAGADATQQDDEDDSDYWNAYGGDSQIGDEPAAAAREEEDEQTVEAHPASTTTPPDVDAEPTPRIPQQEDSLAPAKPHGRDRSATVTPATASSVPSSPAHNPAPNFNHPSAPSPPLETLTPPDAKEHLYFSNLLPPLSPSHFGISPTSQDPHRHVFASPTASMYSTMTPRPMSIATPYMSSSGQFSGTGAGEGPPKAGHARRPSDVFKDLPSHPAFPVISHRGDAPSHASPAPAASAPPTPSQFTFPPSASSSAQPPSAASSSPRKTGKSSTKALPPAPSQIEVLAPSLAPPAASASSSSSTLANQTTPPRNGERSGTSPSRNGGVGGGSKLRKGPPAPLSPNSLAPNGSSSTAPLSPRPRTPRSPGGGAEKPTPPRPGSTYFPLRSPTAAAATAPIPSVPSFPSTSSASALAPPVPPFPPPSLPANNGSGGGVHDPPHRPSTVSVRPSQPPPIGLVQRGRFGSLDSAMGSVRSSVDSTATAGLGRGVGLALGGPAGGAGGGEVDEAAEEHLAAVAHEPVREEREADDALRAALAGVWGLFAAGASGREEQEERRRRFKRVVGEVVRTQ